MQTIVIYDDQLVNIQFFVLQGDYSHLHDVYINSCDSTDEQINKLNDLMYDKEGFLLHEDLGRFPCEVLREDPDAIVIVCGFIP